MKQNSNSTRASARSLGNSEPIHRILSFALAAFFVASPSALAGSGGLAPGGGDSVGSLPSTSTGRTLAPTHAPTSGDVHDALAPRLVLVGTAQELARVVVQVSGSGSSELTAIGGSGLVQMTFTGHVDVVLDRQLLASSFVEAQLEV